MLHLISVMDSTHNAACFTGRTPPLKNSDNNSDTLQHASLVELLLLKYSNRDSHTLQDASLAELLLLK